MSHVTCHLSYVTFQIFFLFLFLRGGGGQSGEISQGRVCYQRGLPRLVVLCISISAVVELAWGGSVDVAVAVSDM